MIASHGMPSKVWYPTAVNALGIVIGSIRLPLTMTRVDAADDVEHRPSVTTRLGTRTTVVIKPVDRARPPPDQRCR